MNYFRAVISYFKMIKIEHSLFALPFALSAMVMAAEGLPEIKTIIWILFCMVFARSGAMGFNRWADAKLDRLNPRTAMREIPAGKISEKSALIFTIISFILFVIGTLQLNPLSFKLSAVPIVIFILYSYSKRFTVLCHFILGISLGLAPIGAWIAVTGVFDPKILFLSAGIMAWVAGFDLLYALQDINFDREYKLYSVPSRLGLNFTVISSRYLHAFSLLLFALNGIVYNLNYLYYISLLLSAILVIYEHYIIFKYGLVKLDAAFFNTNATISIILFIGTVLSVFV